MSRSGNQSFARSNYGLGGTSDPHAKHNAIGEISAGGVALTTQEVHEQRRKKGLCVTCGRVQTHKIRVSMKGIKMQPINKAGEVHDGWCLQCHNIDNLTQKENTGSKKKILEESSSSRSVDGGTRKTTSVSRSIQGSCSILTHSTRTADDNPPPDHRQDSAYIASEDSIEQTALPHMMEETVQEMLNHKDSPEKQASGCAELANKYCDEKPEILVGFIDVIVDAMNRHEGSVEVQKEACRAFRRFTTKRGHNGSVSAGDEVVVDELTSLKVEVHGGIHTIISAMNAHEDSRTIQREGMRVLRNILRASTTSKEAIVEGGGLETIIGAMWAFDEAASIQEDGCIILWSLGYNDIATQFHIMEKNGIGAVLNGMSFNSNSENIQYYGCGALYALASDDDVKQDIIDNGGFDVLMNAVGEHKYSEKVTEKAIGALVKLAVSENEEGPSKLCVISEDEIGTVVDAMKVNAKSVKVQRIGLCLLEVATRSRSSLEILRENPLSRQIITEAMRKFPDDCQESGGCVLENIDRR